MSEKNSRCAVAGCDLVQAQRSERLHKTNTRVQMLHIPFCSARSTAPSSALFKFKFCWRLCFFFVENFI